MHRFIIHLFSGHLGFETLVLIERVVELIKAVGDLFAGDEELETLGYLGIFITSCLLYTSPSPRD